MTRISPSRSAGRGLAPFLAVLAITTAPVGRAASAADASPAAVRALPLAGSEGVPLVAEPGDPLGIQARVAAALAAAKNPDQPVPHAMSAAAGAAPIASRLGKDVTLVRRPGVGTPMQIRGDRLQERIAAPEAAGGADSAVRVGLIYGANGRD